MGFMVERPDGTAWEKVESVLSKLASPRNFTNHLVARSVLRDYWSRLAEQVRELDTGQ